MHAKRLGTEVSTTARFVRRSVSVATVAALAAIVAPGANAQDGKLSSANLDKPDFSGIWDRDAPPVTPNPRTGGGSPAAVTGPAFAGAAPPLKQEFVAAYQAELKRLADADQRGEPVTSQNTMCLPQGMPGMMLAIFPMEVIQTRGQVTIIEEAFTQVRRIYVGEDPPAVEDAEPGFYGHSGGKWDGNTLVVDTVGIKTNILYRNVPHSEEMRIHERMRVIDKDHWEDQVTITDPKYLTGPWSWTWTYKRRPNYKMYEYVCEDNREFADPVTGAQRMRFKDQAKK
jgi:hypothetical protein